jgi:hypothetical protein
MDILLLQLPQFQEARTGFWTVSILGFQATKGPDTSPAHVSCSARSVLSDHLRVLVLLTPAVNAWALSSTAHFYSLFISIAYENVHSVDLIPKAPALASI